MKYGRKLSKRVENSVGKGEITHYEQFLQSHSVFKRLVLQICKKKGLFRKGLTLFLGVLDGLLVKCRTCQLEAAGSTLTRSSFFLGVSVGNMTQSLALVCPEGLLLFTIQSQLFSTLKKEPFENIMGKGKILVTSIFSFSLVFYSSEN